MNTDTLYEGGFFKGNNPATVQSKFGKLSDLYFYISIIAHLYFPKEYPLRPPRMRFVTEIWHPNIDQNGDGKLLTNLCVWTRFKIYSELLVSRQNRSKTSAF